MNLHQLSENLVSKANRILSKIEDSDVTVNGNYTATFSLDVVNNKINLFRGTGSNGVPSKTFKLPLEEDDFIRYVAYTFLDVKNYI